MPDGRRSGVEGARQERLLRGQVQGVGGAEHRAEQREQRHGRRPGQDERGDPADDGPADQVRRQHQGARWAAVGEHAERHSRAARGTAIAISTAPSASPEPVSEITSHDSATKWNWSPTTEIASLAHSSRKSRASSARRNGSDRTAADRERGHSTMIRTPSPSSSTSRTGPR